jgi:undecaprenyl-diphosphatase
MKRRVPLFVRCAAVCAAAATIVFGLLMLLHARLDDPRVHGLDLGVQAGVHRCTSPALTVVMRTLTFIGSIQVFIPTLIAALALMLLTEPKVEGRRVVRKRQVTAIFVLAVGGALMLNEFLKSFFHRARPVVPWSIGDEKTFSFPSGHSLFSMVLYGLIAYMVLERRSVFWHRFAVTLAAGAMTFGIGLSRIYLGMHWPTDVVAGWTTGFVWLCGVMLVDRMWRVDWVRRFGASLRRLESSAAQSGDFES